MKASKINPNLFIAALAFLLSLPVMAFEPAKTPANGSIYLKNGEILNGLVMPLGEFAQSGTLFRADIQSKKTVIPHLQIEKVVIGDRTLHPSVIIVDEKSIPAYLEAKSNGSASLYRAHFYAPKQQGKNNAVTQLQWSWVLHTAQSGLVNLGHKPTPSQLAKHLQHPMLPAGVEYAKLDEQSLIQAVEDHNSAVRSVLTGIPDEERKQDR